MTVGAPLPRYWRTVRHLKPVQLYRRAWFTLHRPGIDPAPPPPVRAGFGRRWTEPSRRPPSLVGPTEFDLLGVTGDLDALGWDDPATDRLWRYHLHYFDDLNAEGADDRAAWHAALIERWIEDNPPCLGTGWEPYPCSLRIVNWIKWALGGHSLSQGAIHSLAMQTRWLSRRLEYHLLGNHIVANAKALIFAGFYFSGPESALWRHRGLAIVAAQLRAQILADGGHFELSPMYHARVLEDLLDLVALVRAYPDAVPARWRHQVERWPQVIGRMREWLDAMCHPDGEIAFFNDAAFGMASAPAQLEAHARRLRLGRGSRPRGPLVRLPASGYLRIASGPMLALLDVARVGPDHQPGHAHADTLSFELSVAGRRVLVNSGTSTYEPGAERLRQRGTAAHNTVVVAGRDSSEMWSSFRVGRRARPRHLLVEPGPPIEVSCAHDGYARLPGAPVHHRRWRLGAGELVVEDRLNGGAHPAEARFHFHPDLQLRPAEGAASGTVGAERGPLLTWRVEEGEAALVPATFHPRFGESRPNHCLSVRFSNGGAKVRFACV